MTNTNDIYTAGLFDGEGTVTFVRTHKNKMRSPQVSLSSTTYELMTFLKENYGGSISNHKTYQDHHKKSWSWKLTYNHATLFLRKILPFMLEPEKIRRAKLLIEEYPKVVVRNGKYSEKQLILREEFETLFFNH